jgi:probable H4MPT-linked C1 transfer pathway protein
MGSVVGWDIGAANVKAAGLTLQKDRDAQERVASRPFEIWRDKGRLPQVLQEVLNLVAPHERPQAMGVTMTAELSDVFATKREGVRFVLEKVKKSFCESAIYVFGLSGKFVPLKKSQTRPLDFAATNWLASAQWIAGQFRDCLIVDVGSTTTDIIPVLDGRVIASGRTDTARLSSGELVFTGVLRTNLSAIVQSVPVAGKLCRVASEYFAISGDVHLILGHLKLKDYRCTTPDGRAPSVDSARSRLARLVCADTETLSKAEINELARYIHTRQMLQIRDGMEQVLSRLPHLRIHPVVVLGAGAFLGHEAAQSLGLHTAKLTEDWEQKKLAVAPSLAVAHLLAQHLTMEPK